MTQPFPQDLPRRLRERGVSQAELARHLGVSGQAVSFWATGQKQPSAEMAERVAAFLRDTPKLQASASRTNRDGKTFADLYQRHTAFERQCELLLRGAGFLRVEPARDSLGGRADFAAISSSGKVFVVDCRLSPSSPKNEGRTRDALAQLSLREALSEDDQAHFLLMTDRPLLGAVGELAERLQARRGRIHVVALEQPEAAARLTELASA